MPNAMYAKFRVNRGSGGQLHQAACEPARLRDPERATAPECLRPILPSTGTKEPKPLDDGVVRMHLNGIYGTPGISLEHQPSPIAMCCEAANQAARCPTWEERALSSRKTDRGCRGYGPSIRLL
jgi:hypothetical protein